MPVDRFKQATRDRKAFHRINGEQKSKERMYARRGRFICKTCRCDYPKECFEYVYEGITRLATNCDWCRYINRLRWKNPNKRTDKERYILKHW